MLFSATTALSWSEKLIALALILQTLELFQIRKCVSEKGIWKWPLVRQEFVIFPVFFQGILDCLLQYPNFLYLLSVRLLCAILVLLVPHGNLHPVVMFVLFLSTLLISLRWRGTFNGGSDYMTMIIVMSLWIAQSFESRAKVVEICLWYIAIQTCLSYFMAGLAKIKNKNWKTGKALIHFLDTPCYSAPASVRKLLNRPAVPLITSWLILVFECSFPIALLNSNLSLVFIGCAFFFHLANVYILGLNRFLFAWTASYPALYWCSQVNR